MMIAVGHLRAKGTEVRNAQRAGGGSRFRRSLDVGIPTEQGVLRTCLMDVSDLPWRRSEHLSVRLCDKQGPHWGCGHGRAGGTVLRETQYLTQAGETVNSLYGWRLLPMSLLVEVYGPTPYPEVAVEVPASYEELDIPATSSTPAFRYTSPSTASPRQWVTVSYETSANASDMSREYSTYPTASMSDEIMRNARRGHSSVNFDRPQPVTDEVVASLRQHILQMAEASINVGASMDIVGDRAEEISRVMRRARQWVDPGASMDIVGTDPIEWDL